MAEKGKIELVISEEIIKEYLRVLHYDDVVKKTREKGLSKMFTIGKLMRIARMVHPKVKVEAVIADKDDNKIIEAALEGKAHFILTYDKHLLQLGSYDGIKIIKPEEFLERLG